MEQDLILNLQDIYSRTALIPVIGSGLSVPFGLPDWKTLVISIAQYYNIPFTVQTEISDLLTKEHYLDAIDLIVDSGVSDEEIQEKIASITSDAKANVTTIIDNNYHDLAKMSRLRYMTTNYDQYLNEIIGAKSFLLQDLLNIKANEFPLRKYDSTVIPLHGEISRPDSIVFTRKSYDDLYDSEEFERTFQHIRSHFTFLFMGFSFSDEYFSKMFERVVGRFDATHYIMLPFSERDNNADKIARLKRDYGVEAVFYDSEGIGHTQAIRNILKDIFEFKDSGIDMKSMERLDSNSDTDMTEEEKAMIKQGRNAMAQEKLSDVNKCYLDAYHMADFKSHTIEFQMEVICGLAWYYGFLRDNDTGEELINMELQRPEIKAVEKKLTFMRAQILFNQRDYDGAKTLLLNYTGKYSKFMELLLDIINAFSKYLPDRKEVAGRIQVYAGNPRTEEERNIYRAEYEILKEKYINSETYNLKNLKEYENCDIQQSAYYYLGIAAGQLFHEHDDAIQYLARANELSETLTIHEEIGHNYLALALDKVRYDKNAKTHQLDMNSLIKAKIRFQHVMNSKDGIARTSFYERSGPEYLQTLLLLRDYHGFEEFYALAKDALEKTEDVMMMKAEADAFYYHTLFPEVAAALSEENRVYIEFLCANNRAELFAYLNPYEEKRIRKEIVERGMELEQPISDNRVLLLIKDSVFFLKDIGIYEKFISLYPEGRFQDEMIGFEDELYGRMEDAKTKYEAVFESHQDYLGTFHILKGFYIRNGLRKDYETLYKRLIANPPDDMFKSAHFYAEMVISEGRDWRNSWNALSLYAKYADRIATDNNVRKELEEILKYEVADYNDYEERIAWNRNRLERAPRQEKIRIYIDIMQLYVANMKYREAEKVLLEMKEAGLPMISDFDNLIYICQKKQAGRRYKRNMRPYFSSDRAYLDNLDQQMNYSWRVACTCLGYENQEVIVSIKVLLYMFRYNRQAEFSRLKAVYISYAGLINLHNSLWAQESPFLRMILQWLERADNVKLFAPGFLRVCEYAPKQPNRRHMAEDIQIKLFAEEHPDIAEFS